jgi:hypothetical protein
VANGAQQNPTSCRRGRKARRFVSAPAEIARVSQTGRTRLSRSCGDFAGFGIGSCGSLVGVARGTPPPCLRLLEPVALAVQHQNMNMMREAIEKRTSETLAAEDGGPFLKGKIRRDDGRAAFVTRAEYFKQKLRAGLRERHIAEFVDGEQSSGGELRLQTRKIIRACPESLEGSRTGGGEAHGRR